MLTSNKEREKLREKMKILFDWFKDLEKSMIDYIEGIFGSL